MCLPQFPFGFHKATTCRSLQVVPRMLSSLRLGEIKNSPVLKWDSTTKSHKFLYFRHAESCKLFVCGRLLHGVAERVERKLGFKSKLRYYQSNFQCHSILHVKCLSGVVFSVAGLGIFARKLKSCPMTRQHNMSSTCGSLTVWIETFLSYLFCVNLDRGYLSCDPCNLQLISKTIMHFINNPDTQSEALFMLREPLMPQSTRAIK